MSVPECTIIVIRMQDLQMPDGSHVGAFFGMPLGILLRDATPAVAADEEDITNR